MVSRRYSGASALRRTGPAWGRRQPLLSLRAARGAAAGCRRTGAGGMDRAAPQRQVSSSSGTRRSQEAQCQVRMPAAIATCASYVRSENGVKSVSLSKKSSCSARFRKLTTRYVTGVFTTSQSTFKV